MVTSDIRHQTRSESNKKQRQSHKSRSSKVNRVDAHLARLGRKKGNTSICSSQMDAEKVAGRMLYTLDAC